MTIFDSVDKTNPFKIIKCDTINEMSYYLDVTPQVISNYYHNQIKARGVLKYCNITQNLKM